MTYFLTSWRYRYCVLLPRVSIFFVGNAFEDLFSDDFFLSFQNSESTKEEEGGPTCEVLHLLQYFIHVKHRVMCNEQSSVDVPKGAV
jgi:hypothetical protein